MRLPPSRIRLRTLVSSLIIAFLSAAEAQECKCGRQLKLVCGNDGHTYENECLLKCAQSVNPNLVIRYRGGCCQPSTLCPPHYVPVCDTQGTTYENECHFEYHKCLAKRTLNINLHIQNRGNCSSTTTTVISPKIEEHSSRCQFECGPEEDFVCDTNDITHLNICQFERVLCALRERGRPPIGIQHDGKCELDSSIEAIEKDEHRTVRKPATASTPQAFGTRLYEASVRRPSTLPLYASDVDPTTFRSSESALVPLAPSYNNHATLRGPQPLATYSRPTAPTSPQPTSTATETEEHCSADSCDKVWAPVCDTRNTTHRNECLYRFRICKLRKANTDPHFIPEIAKHEACDSKPKPTSSAEVESSCKICDENVTRTPVCDNTNHTHQSPCLLAQWNCKMRQRHLDERVLVHVGVCRSNSLTFSLQDEECPTSCGNQYKPVCDSQGMSHPNLCTFQMFNCRQRKDNVANTSWLVSLLECGKESPATPSTTSYPSTESATESETHFKPDEFITNTPKARNQTEFECPEESCPAEKEPICDNEGTVHKNLCMFAYARCIAAREGRILSVVPDDECTADRCKFLAAQECPDEADPICGSDFQSYANDCAFSKAQCHDEELEILFKGDCSQCLKEPCISDAEDKSIPEAELICDQNGETKTLCEFNMIKCIYEIKLGHNITEAYTGRCCPTLDSCPSTQEPVCDTRNRQHKNACYFQVAQCRADKIEKSQTPLALRNSGPCPTPAKQPVAPTLTPPTPPAKAVASSMDGPPAIRPSPTPAVSIPSYQPVLGALMSAAKANVAQDHHHHDGESHAGVQADTVSLFPMVANSITECPFNCTDVYEPLCGSDQITYINKCHFDTKTCQRRATHDPAEVHIIHEGACCVMADCWDEYNPVCDNLGKTHLNFCAFSNQRCAHMKQKSANLTVSFYGPCPGDGCDFECPKVYKPICGSNGETYVNDCELRKLNCVRNKSGISKEITVDYSQECCEIKQCSEFFQPVCDTYGRTHVNKCVFDAERCVLQRRNGTDLYLAYHGACCAHDPCPEEEDPVCDGKVTHSNLCHFKHHQCEAEKKNVTLSVEYSGVCCQRPSGVCEDSGKVCDSDGHTHETECDFEFKRCVISRARPSRLLSILHRGPCCEMLDCPKEPEPVCDSEGRTHQNPCLFRNAACTHNRTNKVKLEIAYDGACCVDDCASEFQPVCDDKGGFHKNECKFNTKKCEAQRRGSENLIQIQCTPIQMKHALAEVSLRRV